MANIFVNDYAGVVEAMTGTITLSVRDVAAQVEIEVTPNTLTTFVAITIMSLSSLTSSFSTTFAAGAPIQGVMRQLALARWNYMYPS